MQYRKPSEKQPTADWSKNDPSMQSDQSLHIICAEDAGSWKAIDTQVKDLKKNLYSFHSALA